MGLGDHNADTVQLSAADGVCEYKHPLHNAWTLWYFKIEKSREWSENQRRVASFGTAEDFWAYVYVDVDCHRYARTHMHIHVYGLLSF